MLNGISGTTLANARMSLDACLVKQGLSSSLMFDVPQTRMQENEELRQYGIKTEMHESLQRVETASCPSCNVLDAGAIEVRQILEVSHFICGN
jgi:hypothetical protein